MFRSDMKSISFEPHLLPHELTLLRGGEWEPAASGWLFAGVTSGSAYWLHARGNQDLINGSVLVVAPSAKGIIRCSQLTETRITYFRVEPKLLTGLVTFHEEQALERAASNELLSLRILSPADPLAQQYRTFCENRTGNHLGARLRLLDFFIQSLGTEIKGELPREEDASRNTKARLISLLREVPACELMKVEFADLAREVCCTPRHLSRTFHELVGVSFRQRQSELRLTRAKELLATTRFKVVDVALESGFQSLSLFNLMFKRHVGLPPAKWREQAAKRRNCRGGPELVHNAKVR